MQLQLINVSNKKEDEIRTMDDAQKVNNCSKIRMDKSEYFCLLCPKEHAFT
jgi:hypothetical protein